MTSGSRLKVKILFIVSSEISLDRNMRYMLTCFVVQMAKKMKKLEKEAMTWKSRFDGCNKALLDMVTDVSSSSSQTFHPSASKYLTCKCCVLMQKTIKEKEFELQTLKTQKLEKLCRALQDERKTLYEKLQKSQPPTTDTTVTTETLSTETVGETEATEEKAVAQDAPTQPTCVPPQPETPLTHELASLKAEKDRLQELAACFTISRHLPPEAYEDDSGEVSESTDVTHDEQQDSGLDADIQQNFTQETDTLSEEHQDIRDKEMESVD